METWLFYMKNLAFCLYRFYYIDRELRWGGQSGRPQACDHTGGRRLEKLKIGVIGAGGIAVTSDTAHGSNILWTSPGKSAW